MLERLWGRGLDAAPPHTRKGVRALVRAQFAVRAYLGAFLPTLRAGLADERTSALLLLRRINTQVRKEACRRPGKGCPKRVGSQGAIVPARVGEAPECSGCVWGGAGPGAIRSRAPSHRPCLRA